MKKPLSFIGILSLIIVCLSLFQIAVSSYLSTTGITLGKLQDQIKDYQTKNSALEEKLLMATSYNRIASSAAEIGFVQSSKPLVLSAPKPFAFNQ